VARATLQEDTEVRVQIESPGKDWTQDPDTLDTWFSSWLWAYETMDEETRRKFYPTSVLVTAPDIIFFWVARMIIAGLEFEPGQGPGAEKNIPFRDVYFTGLIRDKQGRKMSKSLGNSPDPVELVEKYGADGLRFALMRIAPSGQDIRFDEKQIEEGRNFATKLWNAARFRQMHGASSADPKLECSALSIYAIEVLARLNETFADLESAYAEYQFNAVAQKLYDFFWNDYCDWYVEAAKSDIFSEDAARKASALAVMDVVLSAMLRLLHPLMPHVTEELWQLLGFGKDSIQFVRPPTAIDLPSSTTKRRALVRGIYDAVQAGRNLRAEAKIPSNKKTRFILRSHDDEQLRPELPTLARLLNAEEVMVNSDYQTSPADLVSVTTLGEIILPTAIMDVGAERERLRKEIDRIENELKVVRAKLSNKSFTDRAPQAVVDEHHQREKAFEEQLNKVKIALAGLG
jgi:valyl-tRNA synthetase